MYDSLFRGPTIEELRELLDSRSVRSVLEAIAGESSVVCAAKPRLSIGRPVRPWECPRRGGINRTHDKKDGRFRGLPEEDGYPTRARNDHLKLSTYHPHPTFPAPRAILLCLITVSMARCWRSWSMFSACLIF